MAEVVYVFTEPLVINGRAYDVQVCGRSAGNIWEGWIEFEGTDGEVLRTARETTQPNPSVVGVPEVVATPHFDEPAPSVIAPEPVIPDRAVLDPYSVAEKGETLLRKELGALHPWRLRDVVRAYELADESVDLEVLTQAELIELIVAKVVA
jgi:hypothetical protein